MDPYVPGVLTDLWQSALSAYEERTGTDLTTEDMFGDLEGCDSVDGVLTVIDEQMTTFKKFRAADPTWEKLRSALKPIAHVVSSFSEAAGEGVALAVPAGKTIFAAIGVLLTATKGVSASYNSLVDLFNVLTAFLDRLKIREEIKMRSEAKDIVVKILVELLSVLALATKLMKKKRLVKGQYVSILSGNQDVKDAVDRLDKLTVEDSGVMATETFVNTCKVLEHINTMMAEHALNTTAQLNAIKRHQVEKDIIRWLSPPDPSTNHNLMNESHHPGTGDWLLRGDVFKGWKSDSASLLWIHGKPGSGKSVLCSTIIQELKLQALPFSLVYFYFDFRDDAKHNCRGLLSSLVIQLAHLYPEGGSILHDLYSKNQDGGEQPSSDALIHCLRGMLSVRGETFVVLDALDECPVHAERAKVLSVIEKIMEWKIQGLHLCVTSRPEHDIKTRLESLAPVQVNLHLVDQQAEDIGAYIRHVLQHDYAFQGWRPDDANLAIRTLSEQANGMFRWVFCQLEVLRDCLPKHIRHVLKNLPKTLDETYQRILENIAEDVSEDALHLFQCLAFSLRPLTIEELADVLAVDFDTDTVPEFVSSYRPLSTQVLRICSGLVVLNNRVVQFAHFSVQEYLVSERLSKSGRASIYHLDTTLSHTTIAQLCLSMLVQKDVDADFLKYAAESWIMHANHETVVDNATVNRMMATLFNPQTPLLSGWLTLHDPAPWEFRSQLPTDSDCRPILYTSLFGFYKQTDMLCRRHRAGANPEYSFVVLQAAAWAGHLEIVHLLLDHGADVNARGGKYGTAVQAAAYKGRLDVVHLLLERGADVNAHGGEYGMALHAAAFGGSLDVLRLLLEHGADLNRQDSQHGTALHVAARKGNLQVARLLLQHGADVGAQSCEYGTALHVAALESHLEVVDLLLDNGADVNARGCKYGTALHVAARKGNLEVARLLLQHGADVGAQSCEYGTALHVAALESHLEVVGLLLDNGADVNTQGGEHGTALQAAALNGSPEVVHLLLQRGADLKAHGGVYGTVLQAAVLNSSHEVLHILLERGADVNAQGGTFGTVLQAAAYEGSVEVVRLLLDSGADVNEQMGKFGTALQGAAYDGTPEVVRLLLERGADVNAQGGEYGTALQAAVLNSSLDIVHLLLQRGADVNAQGGVYGTALQAAAYGGSPEVVRLLLEAGANVNARGGEYDTALQAATLRGRLDVVSILLEGGADMDARSGKYGTALQAAALNGISDLVHLLLERGADVNAQGAEWGTALQAAAYQGNVEVVHLFLDLGADVNAQDGLQGTALQMAIHKGHNEIVGVLLDRGADVNAQGGRHGTALQAADEECNSEVVRLLLQHGANANMQFGNFGTALQVTAYEGHLSIVGLLLDNGADVNLRGGEFDTALQAAASQGHLEVVDHLLNRGADVDARGGRYGTALQAAVKEGHSEVMQLLLRRGADTNAKYGGFDTSLRVTA
ncbi:ankyrin repeat-containing domain protein [Amylostereum chailletii]|nr:ankyrin repeat-containing domain protein [Amylostereum chailletii]